MDISIPATLISWLAITGGIWKLFERVEKVTSPEAASRWLRNLDLTGAFSSWPATFAAAFDNIFGERHFTWRCFFRSCIASLIAVVIVTCIWGALHPDQFSAFFQTDEWYERIGALFILGATINFIPDYISLLETRYVIRRISDDPSIGRALVFLAIDVAATTAILLGGIILVSIIGVFLTEGSVSVGEFIEAAQIGFPELLIEEILPLSSDSPPSIGIFFYSTFFTSVWVWLYALSGAIVKLVTYLGVGVKYFKRFFDIDNQPFLCLGVVSMIIVSLIYLVVWLF